MGERGAAESNERGVAGMFACALEALLVTPRHEITLTLPRRSFAASRARRFVCVLRPTTNLDHAEAAPTTARGGTTAEERPAR